MLTKRPTQCFGTQDPTSVTNIVFPSEMEHSGSAFLANELLATILSAMLEGVIMAETNLWSEIGKLQKIAIISRN